MLFLFRITMQTPSCAPHYVIFDINEMYWTIYVTNLFRSLLQIKTMEKANVNKYLCTFSHFIWKTEKRF